MAHELSGEDLQVIRRALSEGGMLRALALYREKTGCGIAEAQQYIDDMVSIPAQPVAQAPQPLQQPSAATFAEMLHALALGDVTLARLLYERAAGGLLRDSLTWLEGLAAERPAGAEPPVKLLELAAKYHGGFTHRSYKPRLLLAILEGYNEEERCSAFARIAVLFSHAGAICDRQRSAGHAEWSDVSELLQAVCPGFSERCYKLAYERGMIDSR
jgi:hypothetical protein